jgi:hypothetical protein
VRRCGDRIGPDAHAQATGFEAGFDADRKEAQYLIARDRSEQRIRRLKREQFGETDVVERDASRCNTCARGVDCISGKLQVARRCRVTRVLRACPRRCGQALECRVVRRFGGGHFSDGWL